MKVWQLLTIVCLAFISIEKNSWAENFSTTNIQVLYGTNFHDPFYAYNTEDGNLTTVTLEHFGTWDYGDNYFFIDFLSGSFVNFSGVPTNKTTRIYGEWAPRLSLSKILQKDLSFGIFKDVYLAGQINRDGEGFRAELIGLGTDLDLPLFSVLSLNIYARKDNFNSTTWQVTTNWSMPLSPYIYFDGYIDASGSDNNGLELGMQPQLLVSMNALPNITSDKLQLGIEWYIHRNKKLNSSVPQAMLKWIW